MKQKKHAGFTLVEVIVALFIFSMMATVAASGLWMVIKTNNRMSAYTLQLQQLQITMTIMEQDFTQVVNRQVQDGTGRLEAAFIGRIKDQPYIEFTRMGFSNPLMMNHRSTLQRVAYTLEGEDLLRLTWPMLDRAPTTTVQKRILLKQVSAFKIRYLAENNTFYDSWPPSIQGYSIIQHPLPKAIEITLTGSNGSITRLFLLSGAGFVR